MNSVPAHAASRGLARSWAFYFGDVHMSPFRTESSLHDFAPSIAADASSQTLVPKPVPQSDRKLPRKPFFARSRPTVVIFIVNAPARFKWLRNAATLPH